MLLDPPPSVSLEANASPNAFSLASRTKSCEFDMSTYRWWWRRRSSRDFLVFELGRFHRI